MTNPSFNSATYVDQAATLIALPIPADYHQSVVENFERITQVAQLVLEFPLPEETEIAPEFDPE
ncbi:MAG: DUF4089 domain-containing protein [Leptolyngbyaceae cyanobacterium bins.302]|nr:DUF4089 domain-containing protein [Leptolyngbyaceae cyanobacterium bins.302]